MVFTGRRCQGNGRSQWHQLEYFSPLILDNFANDDTVCSFFIITLVSFTEIYSNSFDLNLTGV